MPDTYGHILWQEIFPPTKIQIKINANKGEALGTVIHELLHVILYYQSLGVFDDELDEVMVLAFDTHMTNYVKKSPKRLSEWTRLIESKLVDETTGEGEA